MLSDIDINFIIIITFKESKHDFAKARRAYNTGIDKGQAKV